ncbi:hypothetical protein B0H13DRAFT_2279176 [Mycena leptocephala]|nr:hypothetical protein B0H13DRAFT_2279176 [Mycena leptocephala]
MLLLQDLARSLKILKDFARCEKLHLFLQFLHISSNISRKRATALHKSEICPVRTLKLRVGPSDERAAAQFAIYLMWWERRKGWWRDSLTWMPSQSVKTPKNGTLCPSSSLLRVQTSQLLVKWVRVSPALNTASSDRSSTLRSSDAHSCCEFRTAHVWCMPSHIAPFTKWSTLSTNLRPICRPCLKRTPTKKNNHTSSRAVEVVCSDLKIDAAPRVVSPRAAMESQLVAEYNIGPLLPPSGGSRFEAVRNFRMGKEGGYSEDRRTQCACDPAPHGPGYTIWDLFALRFRARPQCTVSVPTAPPHASLLTRRFQGDGGWLQVLRPRARDAASQDSLGIEHQSSFEQEVSRQLCNCQVYGFDFSVSQWGSELRGDAQVNSRAHSFHTRSARWTGIMRNRHRSRRLGVRDAHGIIESFKGKPLPIEQMQIEIHLNYEPDLASSSFVCSAPSTSGARPWRMRAAPVLNQVELHGRELLLWAANVVEDVRVHWSFMNIRLVDEGGPRATGLEHLDAYVIKMDAVVGDLEFKQREGATAEIFICEERLICAFRRFCRGRHAGAGVGQGIMAGG